MAGTQAPPQAAPQTGTPACSQPRQNPRASPPTTCLVPPGPRARVSLRDGSGGGGGLRGVPSRVPGVGLSSSRCIGAVRQLGRGPGQGPWDVDAGATGLQPVLAFCSLSPACFRRPSWVRVWQLVRHLRSGFVPVGPSAAGPALPEPGAEGTPILSLLRFLAFCSSWTLCINFDVLKCCVELLFNPAHCEFAPGRVWGSPRPVPGVSS